MTKASKAKRIDHQPAFVLTSYPWRESSLWVEVYSQDYGRVPLLARSARKPQSALRGVMMPFAPLTLSWFGQNELRTLHTAQWQGGWPQPQGAALMSGFYVNELMLKLTIRDDPSPSLFAALSTVLAAICRNERLAEALRLFEWALLTALGVAPSIVSDELGLAIEADAYYLMAPEHNPKRWRNEVVQPHQLLVEGHSLLALAGGKLTSTQSLQDVLLLNRMLLAFRLPEGLHSRHIMAQLHSLK
ncbi:DNA repair protein RecO [Neisseriaceae bacterium CLB008]